MATTSDQLEQQCEHERDDGGALEEHGYQKAGAANLVDRLRLTCDALSDRATDAAEADAGADDGQTDADTGAEKAVTLGGGSSGLHDFSLHEQVEQHCSNPVRLWGG